MNEGGKEGRRGRGKNSGRETEEESGRLGDPIGVGGREG